jgi:hypothetical protein
MSNFKGLVEVLSIIALRKLTSQGFFDYIISSGGERNKGDSCLFVAAFGSGPSKKGALGGKKAIGLLWPRFHFPWPSATIDVKLGLISLFEPERLKISDPKPDLTAKSNFFMKRIK